MNTFLNEKGMALITALLLGFAGIAIVSGIYFMTTYAVKISNTSKQYTTELEVARGVAEYVMAAFLQNQLICNGSPCTANVTCPITAKIDIPSQITDEFYGSHNITACALGQTSVALTNILSASVTSTNPATRERARIEFVYKVE